MSLKQIAKDLSSLSPLMDGRTKVDTATMIKRFPDGFEVAEVDVVDIPDGHYAVVVPKEDPTIFYTGGLVLTKIVDAWIAAEPDRVKLHTILDKEKIKLKLAEQKTRDNARNITTVTVV